MILDGLDLFSNPDGAIARIRELERLADNLANALHPFLYPLPSEESTVNASRSYHQYIDFKASLENDTLDE